MSCEPQAVARLHIGASHQIDNANDIAAKAIGLQQGGPATHERISHSNTLKLV